MNAFRLLGAALLLEVSGYFYNGTFFSTGVVMAMLVGVVVLSSGIVNLPKKDQNIT